MNYYNRNRIFHPPNLCGMGRPSARPVGQRQVRPGAELEGSADSGAAGSVLPAGNAMSGGAAEIPVVLGRCESNSRLEESGGTDQCEVAGPAFPGCRVGCGGNCCPEEPECCGRCGGNCCPDEPGYCGGCGGNCCPELPDCRPGNEGESGPQPPPCCPECSGDSDGKASCNQDDCGNSGMKDPFCRPECCGRPGPPGPPGCPGE